MDKEQRLKGVKLHPQTPEVQLTVPTVLRDGGSAWNLKQASLVLEPTSSGPVSTRLRWGHNRVGPPWSCSVPVVARVPQVEDPRVQFEELGQWELTKRNVNLFMWK